MLVIPQSTAHRVMFMAFLASDHLTPATGKTIAITISKNGAAFANPSAGATNATGIASGWYYVDLSTTDTATVGPLAIRGAEGTIDDIGILRQVMAATSGLINVNAQLAGGSAVDTAATIAAAVWNEDATGHQTQGTFGQAIGDPVADTNTIYKAVVTDATAATVGLDVVAVAAKTTLIPASPAAVGSAMTLTSGERNSIADAYLDRTDGIETGRTPRMALRAVAAAAAGVVAGGGTSVITFGALGNPATTRITTASSDTSGNRPTVTLNL